MNTDLLSPASFGGLFLTILAYLIGGVILLGGLGALSYIGFLLYKHRHRQEESLHSVLLQVAVPRENEIKIDAAEQLFGSLSSVGSGGVTVCTPACITSGESVGSGSDGFTYSITAASLTGIGSASLTGEALTG